MADAARPQWTIDEFLAWNEGREDRHELVDGFPLRMMAGAERIHSDAVVNVLRELSIRLRGKPCRPFNGDSAVETKPRQIRRPNASVDCGPTQSADLLARGPRVVVEALSPTTRGFDTFRKAEEYQLVTGLTRILLIDPNRADVFMWSRDAARDWRHELVQGLDATIAMPEIEIELPLAEIYRDIEFPTDPPLIGFH